MKDETSILIAEDDEFIRVLLAMTFADLPYRLTITANGAEALEAFKTGTYHLVLSDIRMPVMGGYALMEAVTALRPAQRVILMSSDDLDGEILQDLGAYAFLPKPFELDAIRSLIAAALKDIPAAPGGTNRCHTAPVHLDR